MNISEFKQISKYQWEIETKGKMLVPVIVFADEVLIKNMDRKAIEQAINVSTLPGVERAVYVMPDGHFGYGFPIGGVAAFNSSKGGVISAGGVGFDISCGVRCVRSNLTHKDINLRKEALAEELFKSIPAGVGSLGNLYLDKEQMNQMLCEGARWAIRKGYGALSDLNFIEERGCIENVDPGFISDRAKKRQQKAMGTLGSGNHYVEVQEVTKIFDKSIAKAYGLYLGQIVISIHCGSRGLGHQVASDYLREMLIASEKYGIRLPDKELACAPINSDVGQRYLKAMYASMNCAIANRQIISHIISTSFQKIFPNEALSLIYDVSHNTCKVEEYLIEGKKVKLYVHRKGATRCFGPGNLSIPKLYRKVGQPVIIGGSMGTSSYILSGTNKAKELSFSSVCHGAGRSISRHQALKRWKIKDIIYSLNKQDIIIKSSSNRGIVEEAPGAYKDVSLVVDSSQESGLATKVVKLRPLICVKG